MKIISMQIENVLGLREFSLDAGQITEIAGRNAEGKTSVLEALQTAIGGGSLKELKNINAEDDEKARIVLSMRDGDGINYVLDKTEGSLKLKKQVGDSAAFESVGKPQNFLNAIRDCKLKNPLDFLNAKNDKERVEMILQAIDLPFSSDDLWAAIGMDRELFPAIPAGMNALNEISQTRDVVFKKRTGVNTSRRDKRAACEEERRSVPAEIPTVEGITEKEDELSELKVERQRLEDVSEHSFSETERTANADFDAIVKKQNSDFELFKAQMENEFEAEVAVLKDKMNIRISSKDDEVCSIIRFAKTECDEKLKTASEKKQSDTASIGELQPEVERLTGEIATMREQEKSAIRIKTIHERADRLEEEADSLDALADQLTDSLKAIDTYKASMSEDLPVKGLDITNNEISIDGVPWKQLNTATKIVSAVKIIASRAKDYPFKFCVVDGVEALDSDSKKTLIDTLLSNDIQSVLGIVENHDLEVRK